MKNLYTLCLCGLCLLTGLQTARAQQADEIYTPGEEDYFLPAAYTDKPANGTNTSPFIPTVKWGFYLDFFFDNREYEGSETNWSGTFFGTRVAPEIGLGWGGHSVMMGYSMLAEFGTKSFQTHNEIFAYYQYHSRKFRAYGGVIPRNKTIGEYSGAFFSDSVKYFDPNLSGLLLQYAGGRGYVEFACDWNSMWSAEKREKFLLFSAGRLNLSHFYLGYNFSMYHHAGNYEQDGVVDNVWIHPFAGVELRELTNMQRLSLQVGWIQTFQNDRKYIGDYVTPGGFQLELHAKKWNFGVYNTLYAGDNLMPYYIQHADVTEDLDYGPGLYWGEPFYRTSNIYNRLELYWEPITNNRMNLRIASVHHYDGKQWGWQQKVLFSLNLGQNRFFNRK